MSTEAQINANRENAKHSTGPLSPEGKREVRLNAVKHGFAGRTVVLHEHEVADYNKHFQAFRDEYSPVGPTEEFLVQSLAELSFSTQQLRAQDTILTSLAGFKISDHGDNSTSEIDVAVSQAKTVDTLAPRLQLHSIYEQRKMRLFKSTRKELVEIQTERKAREKAELELAAALRKDDKLTRQPHEPEWHPSENGFVCSLQQIDQLLARQRRLERIFQPQKRAA
jgi:hypothetical protein